MLKLQLLYNDKINSLDDVKEDVQNVFNDYNLTPNKDFKHFSFKNY